MADEYLWDDDGKDDNDADDAVEENDYGAVTSDEDPPENVPAPPEDVEQNEGAGS